VLVQPRANVDEPARLFMRGTAGASWTELPLLPSIGARAGFTPAGKIWVLDGLDRGSRRASTGITRPYALFTER